MGAAASAVIALAGCGGNGEATKTVTVQAAPTTSEEAATTSPTEVVTEAEAPSESPGDFFKRLLQYELLGQYGRMYEVLHPAHQELIPRSDFGSCWPTTSTYPQGSQLASFDVLDQYKEPVRILGREVPSTAVTFEATLDYEGSFKDRRTYHAVAVRDGWRWIVNEETEQGWRRGECLGTDITFVSPSGGSEYAKGYPKEVPLAEIPDQFHFELNADDGAETAVAVAPGVWVARGPGTTVRENADDGSPVGYCPSVKKFIRETGRDSGYTCW